MFQITIKQPILNHALTLLSKTTGKVDYNFNTHAISITSTNSSVIMYTYNKTEFMKVELACIQCNGGETAPLVEFNRLFSIIRYLPESATIELKEENGNLQITYDSKKKKPIVLTSMKGTALPFTNITNITSDINMNLHSLNEMFELASVVTEKNNTIPSLSCMKLTTNQTNFSAVSFDLVNKRIFSLEENNSTYCNETASFLLETEKIKRILPCFSDFESIQIQSNSNLLQINEDGPIVSGSSFQDIISVFYQTSLVSGKFPNVPNIFTKKGESAVYEANELKRILQMARAIEDKSSTTKDLHFLINGSETELSFKTQYGELNETIQTTNNSFTEIVQFDLNLHSFCDLVEVFDGNLLLHSVKNKSGTYTTFILSELLPANATTTTNYAYTIQAVGSNASVSPYTSSSPIIHLKQSTEQSENKETVTTT